MKCAPLQTLGILLTCPKPIIVNLWLHSVSTVYCIALVNFLDKPVYNNETKIRLVTYSVSKQGVHGLDCMFLY